ncbi:CFI-box-CTERM domain-containing protein [Acidithiobacillus caldus]|uniref:CFI-box-CTERM domain-containing protein n=1 Tax=Acidithiobacillus caldus TaxID=33059 RepID=UPI00114C88BA|nr:CFI-box-CTERM domain-containing protein [Acidithiobacillus caldus]
MAKRGRPKTKVSILNPRGESKTERNRRIARERRRYGKSGPCFIASAVYGNPHAPEVDAIRRFRDSVLRPTSFGRIIIIYYYKYSPKISILIIRYKVLHKLVRSILNIVAKMY